MKINKLDLNSGVSYRGEGNANLVVALTDSQKILRFPKSKFMEKSQFEKLETIARYVNDVIRPELLAFVDPVTIFKLDWNQLEAIRNLVNPCRPPKRMVKDIFYPAALVMPDYAFMSEPGKGPVLSVEIKPKRGFLHHENLVHPTLCNFCLKQFFKLNVGNSQSVSQYCPLDLYSGEENRMIRAIHALMASPQNNLRIFKDGQLLHGEDSIYSQPCEQFLQSLFGSSHLLPSIIIGALTSTDSSAISILTQQNKQQHLVISKSQCTSSNEQLPENCVLSSVLRLQKRSLLPDHKAQILLDSLLDEGFDMTRLQSLVTRDLTHIETRSLTKAQRENIRMLKDYLMSVTAKDLSIIVTLTEESSRKSLKGSQLIKIDDKTFRFKCSIVDLDPKNLNRISKYVEQKKTWLQAYQQSVI